MTDKSSDSGTDSGKDASTETGGAGGVKGLDDLLSSWSTQDHTQGEPDAKEKTARDQYRERLEALEAREAERSYSADIAGVVKSVKGSLDVDDFIVESWVNRRADQDQRLIELWQNRDSRKSDLDAAVKALGSEFSEWAKEKGLSKPDPDRNRRIGSAVASSREANRSSGNYENLDWAGMSDNELALKKAEIFKAAEQGRL